ncbi:MAG: hypothetical protein HY796_02700 [Elusimicrobia bacterium]|nr:hypothetical protein [Elusimicrobiota bacterium]
MSKKKRSRRFPQRIAEPVNPQAGPGAPAAGDEAGPGKKDYIVIACGLALIALGYMLLKKADPAGENICAKLSPFALLAGYLLIPIALYMRKSPAAEPRAGAASKDPNPPN